MSEQEHGKQIIPVVFAANDEYAPYCGIAVSSLIRCGSKARFYKLYVLYSSMSVHHRLRLKSLETANVHIELIDVAAYMERHNVFTIGHLTAESVYRLLLDQLFPMYEKVLYLDSDLIVRRDVADLYAENVDGYVFAAARSAVTAWVEDYLENFLHLPLEEYFNAGVLLVNMQEFRDRHVGSKCFALLDNQRRYQCMDQDALNLTCRGQVKQIDKRWNVEWGCFLEEAAAGCAAADSAESERERQLENPYIIHYTTPVKPWNAPEKILSEYFWAAARESVFYEEVLQGLLLAKRKNAFAGFIFPWGAVEAGSKVVVYGMGQVGRAFLEQVRVSQYCRIVAVCDREYEKIADVPFPAVRISDIRTFPCDAVIIAINSEQIAAEVRADLQRNGVDDAKIVWQDYARGVEKG